MFWLDINLELAMGAIREIQVELNGTTITKMEVSKS